MLTVGLTGGIASGKSLVSSLLRDQGASVVDADEVYHDLLGTDTEMLMALQAAFGPSYFDDQGRLDRKALAAHVFGKPEEIHKLNNIAHPKIMDETMARVDRLLEKNPALPLVFLSIPLLYEVRFEGMVDQVVVVYASEDVQRQRLMQRDSLKEASANDRLAAQMSIEDKKNRADVIIDNSGSIEETTECVRVVLDRLMLESLRPRSRDNIVAATKKD